MKEPRPLESHHRRFRNHIMHHSLTTVIGHVGRNIDDTSLLFFLHGGDHRAAALPESLDVNSHDTVPFVLVNILKPRVSHRHTHKNSRVVHQPVNLTESIQRLFCHRLATS